MLNTHRRSSGFTLIELMITVAIVAILASIAYPNYRAYVMRSHRAEAKSALLDLQVAQEKFFLEKNRYATAAEVTKPAGEGLGLSATTTNLHYTIALPVSTNTTFTATATATGGQAGDKSCSVLSITETGAQTSTNSSGTASTGCWK